MTLRIYCSTVDDGTMKALSPKDAHLVATNRTHFLFKHRISPEHTTLVHLTYNRTNYCQYRTLSAHDTGDGIQRPTTLVADALVTTEVDQALLLPLADCIGAVIYDTRQHILMVSHLGRHNLEQSGGTRSIEYLVEHFQSDPRDITVWLSPAAGKEAYPLFAFHGHSLHAVAHQQCTAAGVLAANITISPIDTTTNEDYFSHSEYLKGNRPSDGRFAVVAMLRADS